MPLPRQGKTSCEALESIFSDLNHLKVVTSTCEMYADCFGFTEEEVFSALDEYGKQDRRTDVKRNREDRLPWREL